MNCVYARGLFGLFLCVFGGTALGRVRRKTVTAADEDPQLLRAMQAEKAKQDIEKLTAELRDPRFELYQRSIKMGHLADAYRVLGEREKSNEILLSQIAYIKANSKRLSTMEKHRANGVNYQYKRAFELLAADSFYHFLVVMEWNYPPDMKFYANRICVMQSWARELERLEKGELDILGLSGPPRSGKTGIGELFLAWICGRHPDKSVLFATHTNGMAVKAQQDVLSLMTDERRGYKKCFPDLKLDKSVEYLWIDLSPKTRPNNYKTLYFRGIDSSIAGVLEASHLIYCDDLIRGIEEALNPARLDNAWTKYSTDISQRRTNDAVKELHIATRWSTRDPLSRIEAMNEGNPRAEFIRCPGLDEKGESNYNFPYNPLSTAHFQKLRELMDEVSFECIVQQNPIEREGLVFSKDGLLYFDGTLPGKPDFVCAYCDVAWGGGDYLSMPVAACFETTKEAYIVDAVHSPDRKETTKPLVADKLIEYGVTRVHFEANNGGDEYAEDISALLKSRGYRGCAVTHKRAPTTRTKLDRILSAQSEIKGTITDGTGWRLYFLSEAAQKEKPQYRVYMRHLLAFNQNAKAQGKQKDDAADATAGLVTHLLNAGRPNRPVFLNINDLYEGGYA